MTVDEARSYRREMDRTSLRGRIFEARDTLRLMTEQGVAANDRARVLVEARLHMNERIHLDLYGEDA